MGARTLAGGKWIADLEARTPIADAAGHVLTVRLEVVRHFLPLAVRESDKDTEHVHQLRVGTRRARAALDTFACCLPRKVYKRARNQLRDIRRDAGAARDWDVLLADLTKWSRGQAKNLQPGLDCLVGYLIGKRETAQIQLEETGADHPGGLDRLVAETVAAVRKPHDSDVRTLLDLAQPTLSQLLKELNKAAVGNLDDFEHLHQVRILGKKLRYAMEVFADCFAKAFREELYPGVEDMQEMLGNANDSYVAGRNLEGLVARLEVLVPSSVKRYRIGLEALQHDHQTRLQRESQRFQDWWTRWYKAGGESAFLALLKNPDDTSVKVAPG